MMTLTHCKLIIIWCVDLRKVSCQINLANFLDEIGGIDNLERYALEVTSLPQEDGKISLQLIAIVS